jgi:hypothetical protein
MCCVVEDKGERVDPGGRRGWSRGKDLTGGVEQRGRQGRERENPLHNALNKFKHRSERGREGEGAKRDKEERA